MTTLRFELRVVSAAWRRRPWTRLLSVIVLALGIGANAAVFSAVDNVLWYAPSADRPESLVRLFSCEYRGSKDLHAVSLPIVEDYRQQVSALTALAIYREGIDVYLTEGGGQLERVRASVVAPDFFSVLGTKPANGRLFSPADGSSVAYPPYVVLGHRIWLRQFGGDRAVIGRRLLINGSPFEVIGVAPRDFLGLDLGRESDMWLPVAWLGTAEPTFAGQVQARPSSFFRAVGRLAPGTTLERAQAEIDGIAAGLGAGGSPIGEERGFTEPWPCLVPLEENLHPRAERLSWIFLLGALLVLGAAAVDVAGLLVAEALDSRRQTAVQLALGACHHHLLRQALIKTLLLCLPSALVALAAAGWISGVLSRLGGEVSPVWLRGGLGVCEPRVLAFTATAGLAAVAFAIALPTAQAAATPPWLALREEGTGLRSRGWPDLRSILILLQIATSVTLVAITCVLLRSVLQLNKIDVGFEPEPVLAASMDPPRRGYDAAAGRRVLERLLDEAAMLPGVHSAALSTFGPLPPARSTSLELPSGSDRLWVGIGMVSPEYFETLGIELLAGRAFRVADSPGRAPVAIVNRSFAGLFWPGEDATGQRLRGIGPQDVTVDIVGVVEDTRNQGLREPPSAVLYLPFSQFYQAYPWQPGTTTLLLRSEVEPGSMVHPLLSLARRVAPGLPLRDVGPLVRIVSSQYALERLLAVLFIAQSVLVLLLAATGLWAQASSQAVRRRREVAIRLALGATRIHVARQIYGQTITLALVGLALGAALAVASSRLLSGTVFGIDLSDLRTISLALGLPGLILGLAPIGPLRWLLSEEIAQGLMQG